MEEFEKIGSSAPPRQGLKGAEKTPGKKPQGKMELGLVSQLLLTPFKMKTKILHAAESKKTKRPWEIIFMRKRKTAFVGGKGPPARKNLKTLRREKT